MSKVVIAYELKTPDPLRKKKLCDAISELGEATCLFGSTWVVKTSKSPVTIKILLSAHLGVCDSLFVASFVMWTAKSLATDQNRWLSLP